MLQAAMFCLNTTLYFEKNTLDQIRKRLWVPNLDLGQTFERKSSYQEIP